jgi:Fic family protein
MVVGLHDRVAGIYAAGAGRFASGPRWVSDTTRGVELVAPPRWESVPALVDRACAKVGRSESHPAVKAAWIHVGTAAIHPFRDGNGRVARVLASLAMYRDGFNASSRPSRSGAGVTERTTTRRSPASARSSISTPKSRPSSRLTFERK